ncbi:Nucleoside phosphatase [Phaffia rhodozyma]|uniref:Nucleoside phosphatase n=1 Tax=Phaffia rhodozyma TaxID=264483 RepID=A0A0F7SK74_PHARH|nr:Nucleoside phosphatase [Phaffia rhodozyma]
MPPPLNAFASRRYALVIDAGSSGSRLQIYSWRDPKAERQLVLSSVAPSNKGKGKEREREALRRLPRVEKGVQDGMGEWQKKVEPGISSLAASPITYDSVAEYIDPLMAHAINSIPPSQYASTPIYILATAGMRLLPSELSSKLIETTCDVLRKDYPFMVGSSQDPGGPCGETVRIISGEEEGLWGWVAVNYLMDGFGEPTELVPTSISSTLDHSSRVHPYGFLDMGGASTQIAFTPSDSEASAHRESLSSVKLRLLSGEDLDYDVFVASWLGYGTNRARERYVGTLVDKYELDRKGPDSTALAERHISDPCLPKHLTLHENSKLSPLSLASLSAEEAHQASLPHVLKGTGSFSECLLSLQPLLNKHLPCPSGQPHQCLFDALPTPKIDFDHHRFIGVSEYWYSSEHVFNLGGAWDFEEFEKKASEYCQTDWGAIQSKWINQSADKPRTGDGEVLDGEGRVVEVGRWGREVEIPRLQMQCFKAAWLVNVLHEGIGLPRTIDPHPSASSSSFESTESEASAKAAEKNLGPSQKKKKSSVRPAFQSVDTVGDTAISWTLGKMVIEASKGIAPSASSHSSSTISLDGFSYGERWFSFPARLREMNGIVGGSIESVGPWSYLLYLAVLLGVVGFFLKNFKRRILRSPKMSLAGGVGIGVSGAGGRKWRKGLEEGLSSGYNSASEEESGMGVNGSLTMASSSWSKSRSGRWPLTIAARVKHILFHRPNRPRALKQTRSAPIIMRSSSTPPPAPLAPPFMGSHSTFGRSGPALSSSSIFYQLSSGNIPSLAHSSTTVSPPSSPRRLYRPSSDLEPGSPDSPGSSVQLALSLEDEPGVSENETHALSSAPSFRSFTQTASGSGSPGVLGPTNGSAGGALRRFSSNASGGIAVDFHLTPLREILKKTLPPSSLPTLSAPSSLAGGSGWNDPPVGLLSGRPRPSSSSSNLSSSGGQFQTQTQAQEDIRSGVLTPPAGPASLGGSTRGSRNSSRVDLLGLSASGGLTGRGGFREFSRVVNSDGESD